MFHIIWPDDKLVTPERITLWYMDAVANGDLDDEDLRLIDPMDQARALHQACLITLAKTPIICK